MSDGADLDKFAADEATEVKEGKGMEGGEVAKEGEAMEAEEGPPGED